MPVKIDPRSQWPKPSDFDAWYTRRLQDSDALRQTLQSTGLLRSLAASLQIPEDVFLQAVTREYHKIYLDRRHVVRWGSAFRLYVRMVAYLGWMLLRSLMYRSSRTVHVDYLFEEWSAGAFKEFGLEWFAREINASSTAVVCTVGQGKRHSESAHPPHTLFCLPHHWRRYRTSQVAKILAWVLIHGFHLLRYEKSHNRPLSKALQTTLTVYLIYDALFSAVTGTIFVTGQCSGISPMAYGCFKRAGGKAFAVIQNGSHAILGDFSAYTMGDVLITWGPISTRMFRRNGTRFTTYAPLGSLRLHKHLASDPPPYPQDYDVCCAGVYFLHDDYRIRKDAAELLMANLARFSIDHPELRIAYCQHGCSEFSARTEKNYIDEHFPGHRIHFPDPPTYRTVVRSRVTVSVCSSVLVEAIAAGRSVVIADYTENKAFFEGLLKEGVAIIEDINYNSLSNALLKEIEKTSSNEKEASLVQWFAPVREQYAKDLNEELTHGCS